MIKYVKVETKRLEVYEKVVYTKNDMQAFAQCKGFPFENCDVIQVINYQLNDFIASDCIVIKNRLHKMGMTIEGVADFKDVYDKHHKSIELFTILSLKLEEDWKEFSIEEKVLRFANIENLYKAILGKIIYE